ncbi:MAG: MoaD/ThiS family protein [Actinobacteria bacterium]|nr:MoaD/ThiS family protein [Actinomycetota bacterium]
MRITARTVMHLASLLGSREVELELPAGSRVLDVLVRMADLMGDQAVPALLRPEDRRPQGHLRIMLNGRDIGVLEGVETVVQDGDEVLVVPPAGGG